MLNGIAALVGIGILVCGITGVVLIVLDILFVHSFNMAVVGAILLVITFVLSKISVNLSDQVDKKTREEGILLLKQTDTSIFLERHSLGKYKKIFKSNKLEKFESIVDLTDADLLNMGIDVLGDRKKILSSIKNELAEFKEEKLKCPKCGSEDLNTVTETSGHTKGFSLCSGLIGYILLGPFGWLCGLCGMGKGRTDSETFWICKYCGNKFI